MVKTSEAGEDPQLHLPVLAEKVLTAWFTQPSGNYIDGTFGRGGHSRLLLERLSDHGRLLVVDRDPEAIAEANRLAEQYPQVIVRQGDFADIGKWVSELGWANNVQGILLDLGVSSPQLDTPERGFSFMRDGDLDMRMNPLAGQSAAEWLATAEVLEIRTVLRNYGEERFARRIAEAIVEAREDGGIQTTLQLAAVVEQAMPVKDKHKHPATRTFQGIRIYINRELEQLESFLEGGADSVAPASQFGSTDLLVSGGRLAVISFHSLEDRIVKRFMRKKAKGDVVPSSIPVTDAQLNRQVKLLGRSTKASKTEIAENPRSRSAILRVAEKL